MAPVPLLARKTSNDLPRRVGTPPFAVSSADGDILFRLGAKVVVDRARRLRWAGASEDGNRALAHRSRVRPHIPLLDARLDVGGNRVRAAHSSPAARRTTFLTSPAEPESGRVGKFAEYGAACLIDRSDRPARIIHCHLCGRSAGFSPEARWQAIPRTRCRAGDELSLREMQILCLISIGTTNDEIAETPSGSPEKSQPRQERGAGNRAQAVALGPLGNRLRTDSPRPK
ncbi:hypothetical protein CU254_28780 [Amycolatopsis sp. AA4]|uniref:response regulator transcription factor n=1 Tax=Actinomycetes TaxID=1760 RepID=UPI0001B5409A|nr:MULTISPECIES: response regulator transcription factor [Actinomycetes]ATY13972.1 hypothetical protein CU254_28780 [Amycolatopsis sp. AA4]